MRSISIILVFLSFLASTTLQAATYKWTDENGNVVYSQQPPKSGPYEVIKGLKQSRSTSSTETASSPDSSSQQSGDNEQSADNAELKRVNCAAAKKNLDIYKVHRRVKDQSGKVTTLSDEERQKRIEEAEAQVRLFCE